jgi:SAM-dependent methyltransferase/uncharacterized protein YbaR (Trm112 family)
MRDELLPLLACPHCHAGLALRVEARRGKHIESGSLSCVSCEKQWPIDHGVPDFVGGAAPDHVAQTTSGFARNWARYNNVIAAEPALNDELFRDWLLPIDPERLAQRDVLDAGCGMGRWLLAAAPHNPRTLVGFDYSDVVHVAFRNTRHLANVHVVRADLFHPPFRRAFDVCYSIGVIHHTPDPEGAFASLLRLVPQGVLHVWVYGAENNEWIERFVSPLRRAITARMPDAALVALSRVAAAELAAFASIYEKVVGEKKAFFYDSYVRHLRQYPQRYLEHIVYDHLVPQLAQYLPGPTLVRWAESRGLVWELSARNENSWRLVVAAERARIDALRGITAPAAATPRR